MVYLLNYFRYQGRREPRLRSTPSSSNCNASGFSATLLSPSSEGNGQLKVPYSNRRAITQVPDPSK